MTACGGDEPLATVTFRLVGAPAPSSGRCPASPEATAPDLGAGSPDTLRLTYRTPEGGLVCDVLLPLDQPAPIVAIPGDGVVDIYAELFAGDTLVGRGRAMAVAIDDAPIVDLPVSPPDTFECARGSLDVGRAFHSATLLPNGRVLVVGGVKDGGQIDPVAGLMPTDAVTVYDPVTGVGRPVSVTGLTPRLGHEAAVLSATDDEVRIALLGGLSVAGDPATTPALVAGGAADPLRWMPTGGAVGAPLEILVYDLGAGSARLEPAPPMPVRARILATSALVGPAGLERPVIAGGWDEMGAIVDFEVVDPSSGDSAGVAPLGAARLASTITDLGDGRALLWGGQLFAADVDRVPLAGEILSGVAVGATPSAQPLVLSPDGVSPSPRLGHSAAAIAPGTVLVTGGFTIAADARTPEPSFAELITVEGATTTVAAVAPAGEPATPAGYLASIELPGGSALVTGGNPGVGHATCPLTEAGLVCAIADAHRLVPTPLALDRVPDLIVARYGHRMTRLADGSILVTGGLHPVGESLVALTDVEHFDPREAAADPLADLAPLVTRLPGDVARNPDGDPVATCTIIETAAP